ncbi:MAG: NAD-dependent deacylase [Chloroflexota bacterium]|nr:NAD-dependent deacylase [Chloroflexota bacterium]
MTTQQALIEQVAELIFQAKRVVVFTGAGISTESGIPDFRGPSGLWTKFNPNDFTFDKFLTRPETRRMSWQRFRDLWSKDWQPNAAHYALAELEKLGKLDCVITQNVDGLHLKAGNSEERVLELHGAVRWVICLNCGKRYTQEEIKMRLAEGEEIPECDDCHGILKAATVSFGQAMPVRETQEAEQRSRNCDLFIVIGSSLVVYPAAYMPLYAVEGRAKLVIINDSPTPMDQQAQVLIQDKAGPVMSRIVERVKQKLAAGRQA